MWNNEKITIIQFRGGPGREKEGGDFFFKLHTISL